MRTRQLLDEVVESVSHTHILCNVTGVEDVLTRGRDANLKFVKRFLLSSSDFLYFKYFIFIMF